MADTSDADIIRTILGDPSFYPPKARDLELVFSSVYEITLPEQFRHGFPPDWKFILVGRGAPKHVSESVFDDITSEIHDILRLSRPDTAIASDEAEGGWSQPFISRDTPVVIVSCIPTYRLEARLSTSSAWVFFLEHEEISRSAATKLLPRNTPLIRALHRRLPRSAVMALSPYIVNKPALNWRFFGREHEIARIVNSDENIVIVGPRRIGKTSLLLEAARRIVSGGDRALYVVLAGASSATDVENRILRALAPQEMERVVRRSRTLSEEMIDSIVSRITRKGPIVLLLDELGNVLQHASADEQWRVIGAIRGFAQQGRLRVVAAAFQEFLIRQRTDPSGPWVNFGSIVYLGGFQSGELSAFLIPPLQVWSDVSEDEARGIVDICSNLAGSHPLVLQYFAQELLARSLTQKHKDRIGIARQIATTDRMAVFGQTVEEIFFKLDSVAIQYIYLHACQQASLKGSKIHELTIDDDAVVRALGEASVSAPFAVRRAILEGHFVRGLTQPDRGDFGRQRNITPLIYYCVDEGRGKVDALIKKLAPEVALDPQFAVRNA